MFIARIHLLLTLIMATSLHLTLNAAEYDVIVYGGTSAGVIAAVQAKRMGKFPLIVCPEKHLGGLSSGGLGWTDTGNKAVIGGLAREFYHRIWQHYQQPEAWKWQTQDSYGNKGQGNAAIDGVQRTMWIFEPHVAEQVFEDLVKENQIPVHRNAWLNRQTGVSITAGRITSITMLDGSAFTGRMFVDATYEGDLLAAAGVSYHVGREAQSVYDEQWNGIQTSVLHHRHHFGVLKHPISPYKIAGDPSSGLLPRISAEPPGQYGEGDHRVQAYCFRMCLTDDPRNLVPFPKPEGYDSLQYELLARVLADGWRETFEKFDPIPNHKTDTNNHGPFSTDNIGLNYDYPDASYERRREIIAEHVRYQQGWLYFLSHDLSVPVEVRQAMQKWGLAQDEFADNEHWPHQIYVREARRMIGQYVMTENELLKRLSTPESVGMGSYTIDSHNVRRYVTPEGHVQNEGDIGVPTKGPYEIAYGSLVPQREQCQNLLVPVCISSSHIAFGSIRMEPVFMILGQSAATAAVMAIEQQIPVQDVPYPKLRERLLQDGQVLEVAGGSSAGKTGLRASQLPGIVVDDCQAELQGNWVTSQAAPTFVDAGYRHDGKTASEPKSASFKAKIPEAGSYEVRILYPSNDNRASNVAVAIHHGNAVQRVHIDQRKPPPIEGLSLSLGEYKFAAGEEAQVIITNEFAAGYVVIDAVQWIAKDNSR
jgi:hypothetical protein